MTDTPEEAIIIGDSAKHVKQAKDMLDAIDTDRKNYHVSKMVITRIGNKNIITSLVSPNIMFMTNMCVEIKIALERYQVCYFCGSACSCEMYVI